MKSGWMRLLANRFSIVAIAGLVALFPGCSGSSSTSSVAQVRTADAVPDGGYASINVNNGSVGGTHLFPTVTGYYYVQPAQCTVTFTLGTSNTTYETTGVNLAGGQAYTVLVSGLASTTNSTLPTYPIATVFANDTTGAAAGTVKVRFVHAAPDLNASTLTVSADGTQEAAGLAYDAASDYVVLNGASHSFTITPSSGSPFTQSLSFTTGHSYTVFVMEPTYGSSPAYGLYDAQDY